MDLCITPTSFKGNHCVLLITPPAEITLIMQCFPFFLVQSSFLGSAVQTTPSSNTLWKTNSLGMESISRQRSSSDPPTVHPPVPPLRVTSTSMFALSPCFLYFGASNHGWPQLSIFIPHASSFLVGIAFSLLLCCLDP